MSSSDVFYVLLLLQRIVKLFLIQLQNCLSGSFDINQRWTAKFTLLPLHFSCHANAYDSLCCDTRLESLKAIWVTMSNQAEEKY